MRKFWNKRLCMTLPSPLPHCFPCHRPCYHPHSCHHPRLLRNWHHSDTQAMMPGLGGSAGAGIPARHCPRRRPHYFPRHRPCYHSRSRHHPWLAPRLAPPRHVISNAGVRGKCWSFGVGVVVMDGVFVVFVVFVVIVVFVVFVV